MSSKNYFENISNKWDEMRQGFFYDAVREKAISAAKLEDGRTGVDLGAGTGFITETLIQKGLRVIAIDQEASLSLHLLFYKMGDYKLRKKRIDFYLFNHF